MPDNPEKFLHEEIVVDSYHIEIDQRFGIYPVPKNPNRSLADLLVCSVIAHQYDEVAQTIGPVIPLVFANSIKGEVNLPNQIPGIFLPDIVRQMKIGGGFRLGRNIQILAQPTLCDRCGLGCHISRMQSHKIKKRGFDKE